MRGCIRFNEPTTILVIFMKIKSHKKLLRCNPLSDASYQNSGMVLNRQGPGRHLLGDASYLDPNMVLNEKDRVVVSLVTRYIVVRV
jgi:hypothetical protein